MNNTTKTKSKATKTSAPADQSPSALKARIDALYAASDVETRARVDAFFSRAGGVDAVVASLPGESTSLEAETRLASRAPIPPESEVDVARKIAQAQREDEFVTAAAEVVNVVRSFILEKLDDAIVRLQMLHAESEGGGIINSEDFEPIAQALRSTRYNLVNSVDALEKA